MNGEIALAGVYLPMLLVMAAVALVLTAILSRLLALGGLYRFIAYRPLVDVALFVIILAALDTLAASPGAAS